MTALRRGNGAEPDALLAKVIARRPCKLAAQADADVSPELRKQWHTGSRARRFEAAVDPRTRSSTPGRGREVRVSGTVVPDNATRQGSRKLSQLDGGYSVLEALLGRGEHQLTAPCRDTRGSRRPQRRTAHGLSCSGDASGSRTEAPRTRRPVRSQSTSPSASRRAWRSSARPPTARSQVAVRISYAMRVKDQAGRNYRADLTSSPVPNDIDTA